MAVFAVAHCQSQLGVVAGMRGPADLIVRMHRFKECTGKSVEMLEREKADKQHLQTQNSAQVGMGIPGAHLATSAHMKPCKK